MKIFTRWFCVKRGLDQASNLISNPEFFSWMNSMLIYLVFGNLIKMSLSLLAVSFLWLKIAFGIITSLSTWQFFISLLSRSIVEHCICDFAFCWSFNAFVEPMSWHAEFVIHNLLQWCNVAHFCGKFRRRALVRHQATSIKAYFHSQSQFSHHKLLTSAGRKKFLQQWNVICNK